MLCFFNSVAQLNYSLDTIQWRADYQLKPEDFKGKMDSNSIFSASSGITLYYRYSILADVDSFSFKTYCIFDRQASWLNRTYLCENLMEHEQGHFNIGEIFRRKLDSVYHNYKPRKYFIGEDLKALFNSIKVEMYVFDADYDIACARPPDPAQQKIWTKKILDMLNEY